MKKKVTLVEIVIVATITIVVITFIYWLILSQHNPAEKPAFLRNLNQRQIK